MRKEKVPVVIYLTNGVRLKGTIQGFDNFVVVLKESTQQLVYKHAISTIMPQKEFDFRPSATPREPSESSQGPDRQQ